MILATLLAVAAFSSAAEDFYPMAPGAKWTYEDQDGHVIVDQLGAAISIDEVPAFPMTRSIDGRAATPSLYRFEGDSLMLVGTVQKVKARVEGFKDEQWKTEIVPIKPSQVIFKAGGTGKSQWKYVNEVTTSLGPVLQQSQGDSSRGPKRKFDGRDVDTLVVHVYSRVGNEKNGIDIRDDVVYGKGIGMLEWSRVQKAEGDSVKTVQKLVKYEPPQG